MLDDLSALAQRQLTGGFTPPAAVSRKAGLAATLISTEGARSESAELLADMMMDRLRWPESGGGAVVVDANGNPEPDITAADLTRKMREAHPWAFAGGPVSRPSPVPTTLTGKAIAERDARQASAKAEADTVNPYLAATRNLTRQAVMERDEPARAAKLRAEAGV